VRAVCTGVKKTGKDQTSHNQQRRLVSTTLFLRRAKKEIGTAPQCISEAAPGTDAR